MQVKNIGIGNYINNISKKVTVPFEKPAVKIYTNPAFVTGISALSGMYLANKSLEDRKILDVNSSEIESMKISVLPKSDDIKDSIDEVCILPAGTKFNTKRGVSSLKIGECVGINNTDKTLTPVKISDVLKNYQNDILNPVSEELFALLNHYKGIESSLNVKEKIHFQDDMTNELSRLNKGKKLCELAKNDDYKKNVSLKEEYELSAELVDKLEKKYFSRIDVSNFDKALKQAEIILKEIYSDNKLNPDEKQIAVTSVMVRLLPKTNSHQHLKGSVPKDVTISLAKNKGYSETDVNSILDTYSRGKYGYDSLNSFTIGYQNIGNTIKTPSDYEAAIRGIVSEALKQGQLTCEIRCAVDSLKDETGKKLSAKEGTEAIIKAMDKVQAEVVQKGLEPPKMGLVFLSYRGRDWSESLSAAKIQAQEAVNASLKYPDKKFGFDIAGPEDTGYSPKAFKDAVDIIKSHNEKVEKGLVNAQKVGITMHAGETPTYDNGKAGYLSVEEALEMGVDRIGHGVQAVLNADTIKKIKDANATVEICGVCNVQSIPVNTEGFELHPIQEFINNGVNVTVCTDNDAICSTNISKEYMQFLLTGHSNVMNWNNVKKCAKNGIETAFISDKDKADAIRIFDERVNKIQNLVKNFMD